LVVLAAILPRSTSIWRAVSAIVAIFGSSSFAGSSPSTGADRLTIVIRPAIVVAISGFLIHGRAL